MTTNTEVSKLQDATSEIVAEIFSNMVMMEVTVHQDDPSTISGFESNITGIIGLGGELKGMVAVHMTSSVALAVTGSFLGVEPETLDDDVKDAIGEIANMIAGGLKVHFTESGVQTELAIPSTIVGTSYKTGGIAGAEKLEVPFSCDAGVFCVEVKYLLQPKRS